LLFFISAEEVEKMKEKDMFEQLLSEMVEEFPHMAKVLVYERDVFLAGFLQKVSRIPVQLPENCEYNAWTSLSKPNSVQWIEVTLYLQQGP